MNKTMFRPDQLVEVRSAAEILATLDDKGSTKGVPFMPEMLPHVGRRYRVAQQALKICAPGKRQPPPGVVYLEDLRCDGAGPRRLPGRVPVLLAGGVAPPRRYRMRRAPSGVDGRTSTARRLADVPTSATPRWPGPRSRRGAARPPRSASGHGRVVEGAGPVRRGRSRSGNVGLAHFTRVVGRRAWPSGGPAALAASTGFRWRVRTASTARRSGSRPGSGSRCARSRRSAGRSTPAGRHRGLTFTDEMAQYCGKRSGCAGGSSASSTRSPGGCSSSEERLHHARGHHLHRRQGDTRVVLPQGQLPVLARGVAAAGQTARPASRAANPAPTSSPRAVVRVRLTMPPGWRKSAPGFEAVHV